MRIFTPGQELPFAGHPTIGTAFVLATEGRIYVAGHAGRRGGRVPGRGRPRRRAARGCAAPAGRSATCSRTARSRPERPGSSRPISATTSPCRSSRRACAHLMVPVRDLEALRRAARDEVGSARSAGRRTGSRCTCSPRPPTASPRGCSTGSTASARTRDGLGRRAARRVPARYGLAGMPGSVGIRQGEQVWRPSLLEVQVTPEGGSWRVVVEGGVAIVGDGRRSTGRSGLAGSIGTAGRSAAW